MRTFSISSDRARRVSDAEELALPPCDSMHFEEGAARYEGERCQRLNLGRDLDPSYRIATLEVLRLHGPSYSVADGAGSMTLTHVLRHSPGGLMWRNGWGEISRIEPGGVFVNQGRKDSLVEVSPSPSGDYCDCIRIALRTSLAAHSALRFKSNEFPVVNSSMACFRVMLGGYGKHGAQFSPLPGMTMLDIDIAPYSEIEIPVREGQVALAILTSGTLQVCGMQVEPWHSMLVGARNSRGILATRTGASVIWLCIPIDAAPTADDPGTVYLV